MTHKRHQSSHQFKKGKQSAWDLLKATFGKGVAMRMVRLLWQMSVAVAVRIVTLNASLHIVHDIIIYGA